MIINQMNLTKEDEKMKMIFLKILRGLGILLITGGALIAVGLENNPMEQFNYIIPYCYLSVAIGAILALVAHFFLTMPPPGNYSHNP